MRVIVCGGRNWKDRELLDVELNLLWIFLLKIGKPMTVLIHGGAKGVDTMAGDWAFDAHIPTEVFKAEWDRHGKKAGILRNIRMLNEGKPDLVVAFPGGRGTGHMVRIAREAGVQVKEISYESANS